MNLGKKSLLRKIWKYSKFLVAILDSLNAEKKIKLNT